MPRVAPASALAAAAASPAGAPPAGSGRFRRKRAPILPWVLGFCAVFAGGCSSLRSPTWGNVGAVRRFGPIRPAKPPRSCKQGSLVLRVAYLNTCFGSAGAGLVGIVIAAGTVKDFSQICRCLGGAIGAIGLHPALLLFEQRYVWVTPAAPQVFDYVFQPGGHQHQRGFPVGERADDAGSAANLPVRPLDGRLPTSSAMRLMSSFRFTDPSSNLGIAGCSRTLSARLSIAVFVLSKNPLCRNSRF